MTRGTVLRDHAKNPPQGHLETAHLSIVAIVDLVPEIFTDAETGLGKTAKYGDTSLFALD